MTIPLKQYWDLLSRYIAPQRARFFLLAALLIGSIGLQIANPQIMRSFIDTALNGGAMSHLLLAAAAFIGIALLQQGVSVAVTYLGENVAWTATNALRAELARHCLGLDMSFHNEHTPGELIERIDGDVTELATFFSQFVVTMIGNVLLLSGILVVLFFEDWRAGLAFTVFAVITLYTLNRFREFAIPDQKARRQAEADLFGFVEEQLNGSEDVRSSGAVPFVLRELTRLQAAILKADRRAHQKGWVINDVVMGGLLMAGNIMALVTGYLLFDAGAITIGTVYLLVHYLNLIEGPIWALTRQVGSFQTIGACVQRLSELRKSQSRVKDEGQIEELPEGPLGLAFEGVSFMYHDGNDNVLTDLSFELKPGNVLGLLGRTGSGKTTLTRLVFRLYDPTAGRIRLDGADLRDTRLTALRQRVAVVTQDVQLFRASVRDNLTFFDRSTSDEQIRAVIEELELSEWLHSLPNGLDTILNTGGHSLSAGEAQLLALARVFLRNPSLVILDEASSRLDPATEQRIERALDKLLCNRTAIMIAHRLNTVHRADEIMILEGGRISEYGPRARLAADPDSQFYQLLKTGLEEVLV